MKCAIDEDLYQMQLIEEANEIVRQKVENMLDQMYEKPLSELIDEIESAQCDCGTTCISRQRVKHLMRVIEDSVREIAEILSK